MNHLLRFGIRAALLLSTHAAFAQTEPPGAPPASPPDASSPAPAPAPAPAPQSAPEAAPAAQIPATPHDAETAPRDTTATPAPAPIAPIGEGPNDDPYATPAPWSSDRATTPRKVVHRLSETRGFAAAAQFGYAWPAGGITAADGDELSKSFGGQASFMAELGARVTPSLFVGVYGGYAWGGVAGALESTCSHIDCSAYSARGGVAIRYRFFPAPSIQPWIGYAAGYERTAIAMTNGVTNVDLAITGFELAHLSAGLDWSDDELHAFGPVLDVGIGEYRHVKGDAPQSHIDQDIMRTSLHEWVTLGVRWTIMP